MRETVLVISWKSRPSIIGIMSTYTSHAGTSCILMHRSFSFRIWWAFCSVVSSIAVYTSKQGLWTLTFTMKMHPFSFCLRFVPPHSTQYEHELFHRLLLFFLSLSHVSSSSLTSSNYLTIQVMPLPVSRNKFVQ